jgi:hypothetical protein
VAASLPYPGISDPEVWRELLARGAMLRATQANLSEIIARSSSISVDNAMSGFALAARTAAGVANDNRAVGAAAAEWQTRLAPLITGRGIDSAERKLFKTLSRDLQSVHSGDPFGEMFRLVAAWSAVLYGESWPDDVSLDVAFGRRHPRRRQDHYGLAALASATAAGPCVTLVLYPDDFGPEAYAVLPYVFAHECVCHVAARQLGEVNNSSLFAEGFMDWATSYWLAVWMGGLPLGLGALVEEHEPIYRAALLAEATDEAIGRGAGRRIAAYLSRQLSAHHGLDKGLAGERVARFAVEMNVAEASLAAKDDVLDRIDIRADVAIPEPLLGALEGKRLVDDIF